MGSATLGIGKSLKDFTGLALDRFLDFFEMIGEAFTEFFGDKIPDLVRLSLGKLAQFGSWIWNHISGFATWLWSHVGPALGWFKDEFIKFFTTTIPENVSGFAQWVWDKIGNFKAFVWDERLWPALQWFTTEFIKFFTVTMPEGIVNFALFVWEKISNFKTFIWDENMLPALQWFGTEFVNFFSVTVPESIIGFAGWIWEQIKTIATDLWELLHPALQEVGGWIADVGNWISHLAENAWDFAKVIYTKIKTWITRRIADFKSLGTTIGDSIYGGIKDALGALGWVIDKVTGAFKFEKDPHEEGLQSGRAGPPNLSAADHFRVNRRAKGGLITKPELALIGEAGPELVVPLNKLRGLGGNMQFTYNNYAPVYGQPNFEEAVAEAIRYNNRRERVLR